MPYIPNHVDIKLAIFFRNALIFVGVLLGLISWLLLGSPNTGTGMLTALGAMACFLIAFKIKTKRYYSGSVSKYR